MKGKKYNLNSHKSQYKNILNNPAAKLCVSHLMKSILIIGVERL